MHHKIYNSRDFLIFMWGMVPYTLAINSMMYGSAFFLDPGLFVPGFFIGLGYYSFVYFLCSIIALLIKSRYPEDGELFKRIAVMLPIFYVLNILLVQGLYEIVELLKPASYFPLRSMQWWVSGLACIAITVFTFLKEAMAGWNKWKASITETEQLKYAYQKTRFLGLKGQVNPHFLFNCFNSLSSLISDDGVAAEKFLDEMAKVHRYMLRTDDEVLTTLRQELTFSDSYLYLIKQRFGNAIYTNIQIDESAKQLLLPPLSLQVILENIIYNHVASKQHPLEIRMEVYNRSLVIKHTVHLKSGNYNSDEEEGIDNLIKKYELLNASSIKITETLNKRTIILPLMEDLKQWA